jgi:NAD(P)-dependent dehydrogenase (short-subunit alcohol dehydrogenase family)
MQDLNGKVAFVTGGSSGIGLGIVRALAAAGMRVAFTWRNRAHLDEAMAYFDTQSGQQALPLEMDVTDRAAFARAADETERTLGPVQVLVNNAGVGILGMMEDATYDDWDWIVGVNLGGVINAVVTFLPRMLASGQDGHIVNVSSMGGITVLGNAGLYATTKFAVVGLSESLRTDLRGRNIGVSVYCPGPVKSNIGDSGRSRPAHLAGSGYAAPLLPEGASHDSFMATAMDADEAARHVLRGIRENRLFILSHPEFRDVIAARNAALLAAVPDEPADAARVESIRWLLSNPIYTEDT